MTENAQNPKEHQPSPPADQRHDGSPYRVAYTLQASCLPPKPRLPSHHSGSEASQTQRREEIGKRAEGVELVEDLPQSLACLGKLAQALPLETCAGGKRSHLHQTIVDLLIYKERRLRGCRWIGKTIYFQSNLARRVTPSSKQDHKKHAPGHHSLGNPASL